MTRALLGSALLLVGSGRLEAALSPDWQRAVTEQIRRSEYEFSRHDGLWSAPNRAQNLRASVSSSGLRVLPRVRQEDPWELRLRLAELRRGAESWIPAPERVTAAGNRVEIAAGRVTEWFVNAPAGLEHGFTLSAAPGSGGEPLVLELVTSGSLSARHDEATGGIGFLDGAGRQVLRYAKLIVSDADGRQLPARFAFRDARLRIVVDDGGARYPVVVDPVFTVPDWVVEGDQTNADFGVRVASAGDVDGDGYDDVIVGAEDFDNGQQDEGRVFVYLGTFGGPDVLPHWTGESNHAGGFFGCAVSSAGDVNNDGYDEIIVGAQGWDDGSQTDEGGAFVFYGGPTGLDQDGARPAGTPLNADWHAEGNQALASLGSAVTHGNVNADLYDDVIVGAQSYSNDQSLEGAAFSFHGSATGLDLNGTRPIGTPANRDWGGEGGAPGEGGAVGSHYGYALSSGGDVNNDGYDDLLVGAYDFENNFLNEGRVYLYRGSAAGLVTAPVWIQDGGANFLSYGVSVALDGNYDGDAYDDVLVGADDYTNGSSSEGGVFLYRGNASFTLGPTPAWIGESNQGDAYFGNSLAWAGDVNGDGFDDILVGALGFDDGQFDEGAVFLYYGSDAGIAAAPNRIFEGDQDDAQFGSFVAGAGDVNGDGFDDVLIGADDFTNGQSLEGAAAIFFGCQDSDLDGVCTDDDNCAGLPNPAQEDADADGLGDVCDACDDVDDDGICDRPRVLVEWSGPGEEVLIEYGSSMRYLANTDFDPGVGLTWTTFGFPDQVLPWKGGLYGVGYEDPPAGAPVGVSDLLLTTDPPNIGTWSIYTRSYFTISDPDAVETLFLGADYDDAYVAWINGVEVVRSGEMTAGIPQWNTEPHSSHESSNGASPNYGTLHDISVVGIPVLQEGTNVLAVGVWNRNPFSSDLVLVPRLSINRPKASTMRYRANTADPGLGLGWTSETFDDSGWSKGNYGIGFETASGAEDLINTDVSSAVRSIYTRAKFTISLGTIDSMFLGLDWDDGYAVWINGAEMARSAEMPGTPGDTPAWNASPSPHESSNGAEPNYGTPIDLTLTAGQFLQNGENVLAIGVWNNVASSADDLVVVPRLSVNEQNIDNCLGTPNPSQDDTDMDGLGDACDPDIDNDTLANAADNCPYVANLSQDDFDADSIGDACDSCPDDAGNDEDGDGICAGTGFQPPKTGDGDNCPTVANPDQFDQDTDGLGNACDPDIDGDGFLNEVDNCPLLANDQTNADGDANGAACDCDDGDLDIWEQPADVDTLVFARHDVCVNYTCTESLTACGTNADCVFDHCTNFTCTDTLGPCDTDADCEFDRCANYTCKFSAGNCNSDADCTADFCAGKACTEGLNACTSNAQCTHDTCANKTCTEGGNLCTTNDDCINSPTDLCIGLCSDGGNPCASDAACTQDQCRGTCSIGGNSCSTDSVCTQDTCEGLCLLGGNPCVDNSVCTAPQQDICRGSCQLGGNNCFDDTVCTQPQTDECKGSCALSDVTCVTSSVCTDPSEDTLRWQAPASFGATTGRYDTLRSPAEDDFFTSTACLDDDASDTETVDVSTPAPGVTHYYLIRTENDCPTGGSTLGKRSSGAERTGVSCP